MMINTSLKFYGILFRNQKITTCFDTLCDMARIDKNCDMGVSRNPTIHVIPIDVTPKTVGMLTSENLFHKFCAGEIIMRVSGKPNFVVDHVPNLYFVPNKDDIVSFVLLDSNFVPKHPPFSLDYLVEDVQTISSIIVKKLDSLESEKLSNKSNQILIFNQGIHNKPIEESIFDQDDDLVVKSSSEMMMDLDQLPEIPSNPIIKFCKRTKPPIREDVGSLTVHVSAPTIPKLIRKNGKKQRGSCISTPSVTELLKKYSKI